MNHHKVIGTLIFIVIMLLLATCAISFSGQQDILYIEHEPVLSGNTHSQFESITLHNLYNSNTNLLNNNKLY